jgi:acetyl esterase
LFVTAAALDPLGDDTVELVRRLEAAGVPHQLVTYPGVVHGFLQMSERSTAARAALREAGEAIRAMLA